jgi:NADPH-dependent 7-cyano-7-deazaguanine reductase QueF
MRVTHTFPEVKGTCPVNGEDDYYRIVVEFTYDTSPGWKKNVLYVETLSDFFKEVTKEPISQESLTYKILHEFYRPGILSITVKTLGNHGDVRTETEMTYEIR